MGKKNSNRSKTGKKSQKHDSNQQKGKNVSRNAVQPEEMSLMAHRHIMKYLDSKSGLDKDDTTAVQRLSQHLRVFGLLSAAGYVNQSNEQEGKVRQRTTPVWICLLGQLLDETEALSNKDIKETVLKLAKDDPTGYMAMWRKSLNLSNHWNFWAKAYSNSDS